MNAYPGPRPIGSRQEYYEFNPFAINEPRDSRFFNEPYINEHELYPNRIPYGFIPQREMEYDKDMLYIYSKYRPTISVMKKIPPSRSPIEEVTYYLKEIMYFDREIEKSKELLAQQRGLKLVDLFNLFDYNRTGQIVLEELKAGLIKFFEFIPKQEDLQMLILRYSRDGNGRLR